MAYQKGNVQVITAKSIREERDWLEPADDPADYAPDDSRDGSRCSLPVIVLPHSCTKWIIGGPDEARTMIEDLTEAIQKFEAETKQAD